MSVTKDQAIVLRRLDYSETSQVLVFFTRGHGPQRLIAKGIKRGSKKRFAPAIDLLELGKLAFFRSGHREGGLGTLTEWRQLDAFLGLRRELRRLYAAQYAAEITATMTEEADPHPRLYAALSGLLSELATGEPVLPRLIRYQCTLLEDVGLWPDLTRCVLCDRPAPPGRSGHYSPLQGGLVCRACVTGVPEQRLIPAATLTQLRERTGDESSSVKVFDVLNYTISHIIGRPPVTARFLN